MKKKKSPLNSSLHISMVGGLWSYLCGICGLVSNKKRPCLHIIIGATNCRCTRNIFCKGFPNCKRRILSLVNLKTSAAFLKINSINDICSEFIKIFRATIFRERFPLIFLQEITVYCCDWF